MFEHQLNEYKSVQVTRVIHDFYETDPKRGFYGGGGIDARIGPQPTTWAIRTGADGPRGARVQSVLAEFPRTMSSPATARRCRSRRTASRSIPS